MKMYDFGIIILVAIVVGAAVIGAVSVKYLGPHNAIEEMAEEVIKEDLQAIVDDEDAKKNP